jgi:hypothetical protein
MIGSSGAGGIAPSVYRIKFLKIISYEVAVVFVGASDHASLEDKYQQVLARLPLEFAAVDDPARSPSGRPA